MDYSLRNWDGKWILLVSPLKMMCRFLVAKFHSIWDVDTKNIAFFLKDKITLDKFEIDLGLRYDDTEVTSGNPAQQANDYDALNGYIFGTYHANESSKYFAGFGKSSRVPDGKELYWLGSKGNAVGTPHLDQTINYEFDMGIEKQFENASIKAKVFYSKLKDYIAYNASSVNGMGASLNAYENVDATLYGFEFSGTYIATDSLCILIMEWHIKKEKKDTPT